ncbi:MAG: monophosphatase [Patescibacteria group bacterium]|nr:monophosphatase [Patescibacteria group bacterium]
MEADNWNIKVEKIKQKIIDAGKIGLQHFRSHPINVIEKTTFYEIVTEQDIEMEELIKEEILKNFPGSFILAEESPTEVEGDFWTVDPLDGTSYYQKGLSDWSVNVAYIKNKEVVLAITYCPVADELFYSEKGKGAYLNGERIYVSDTSDLKNACFFFGYNYLRNFNDPKSIQFRSGFRTIWSTGSTALALANLAAGRVDVGIQINQSFWDITGMLHVTEAGGKFTNWKDGTDFEHSASQVNNFCATNGKLHALVMDSLAEK